MSKISLQMFTMRDYTKTPEDLTKTIEKLSDIGFEMLQYSIPESFDAKEVKKIFDGNGITNDSVFTPWLKLEENYKSVVDQCELFGTNHVCRNI